MRGLIRTFIAEPNKPIKFGTLPKVKCVGCKKIIKGTIIDNGFGY